MMRFSRRLLPALAFTFATAGLAAGCGGPAVPSSAPHAPRSTTAARGAVGHVVVVTLDGLLPEAYTNPDAHGLRVPTLRRIVREGAASPGALSVFPTVTYPSHTSMVTGVNPGRHGIVANKVFDPLEREGDAWRWYAEDIQRDPVWRIAQQAGLDTAMVHWPVSVGADVRWRVPEYWRAKSDDDTKLVRSLSTPGLLDAVAAQHPDFWSRFHPPVSRDDTLTDIAVHLLETAKPRLLLLHLVEVDGAQHDHGVWSPEALAAMEKDDAQLARLFDALTRSGLASDTNVLVASDHGFMDAPKLVRPGVVLREAGLVTLRGGGEGKSSAVESWKASLVNSSGQAYVYVRDPADTATRELLRRLFAIRVRDAASGISRVYEAEEIRGLGGDPAAFLALEAAPGFQFGGGFAGEYVGPPVYRGTHGYDPRRPELRASLLAVGPTVGRGTLAEARLVDVGPTVAAWLGLTMPDVDGKPLTVTPLR